MFLIYVIIFITMVVGLYLITLDRIHAPSKKAIKNISKVGKERTNQSSAELFALRVGADIGKYLPMTPYKKRTLTQKLRSAGINLTPETYIGQAMVVPLAMAGIGLLLLIFLPVASLPLFVLSILLYMKGTGEVDEKIKAIRKEVEEEMPRFVSTISQFLKHDRDILQLFEMYRKSAGGKFRRELDITIADLKTGNQEQALKNLESRVSSPMLSDVVRGLIGAMNGDNTAVYFEMLDHDFKIIEYERLKSIAIKRPSKVKKYSAMLLMCFLAMFFVVFAVEIWKSASMLL